MLILGGVGYGAGSNPLAGLFISHLINPKTTAASLQMRYDLCRAPFYYRLKWPFAVAAHSVPHGLAFPCFLFEDSMSNPYLSSGER